MKNIIFSLGICIYGPPILAQALIQIPNLCVDKQETPCLIKARQHSNFSWGEQKMQLFSGAVLQIQKESLVLNSEDKVAVQRQEIFNFELLKGLLRIESEEKYKIFNYQIKNSKSGIGVVFIFRNQNKVKILDTEFLDIKILNMEVDQLKQEQGFILEKSEQPDRSELIHFLAPFYVNSVDLKKEFKQIFKKYQKKINLDSKKQEALLQNHTNRHIALAKIDKKQQQKDHQKNFDDTKRSREMFFMRTFEQ